MTCAACGIVRCETQPRVLGGETFAICATCDESDDARLLLAVRVPHHVARQVRGGGGCRPPGTGRVRSVCAYHACTEAPVPGRARCERHLAVLREAQRRYAARGYVPAGGGT